MWYLRYLRIQHTHFRFSWFSATKSSNTKQKREAKRESPFRNFLFSSANFFFDLRVNNRVVVIINYPHRVKTNKKHCLINRNRQRNTAFRFACTWSPRVGRDCASHTDKQQQIELTQIYQRFIQQIWSCGANIPHLKYQLSEISSSPTVKPFKPINYIHTQTSR